MSFIDQGLIKNRLLSILHKDDFARLAPQLTHVVLDKGQHLVEPSKIIDHAWFVEAGVVSVVLTTAQGNQTEVGIVGREGMVDMATIHGVDRSLLGCFVQIPGAAYRVPAGVLTAAMDASPAFQKVILGFGYCFMMQVSGTASANASCTIEQRLARWLLMCRDRVSNNVVTMTHEFLALMLNVRRAGVTVAIRALEQAGLVTGQRGSITIIDDAGLRLLAADFYGAAEAL